MFRRTFTTATPQKLGFFAKTKQQAQFILKGIKLFTQETKDAQLIRSKIRDSGYKVNRQEFVFVIIVDDSFIETNWIFAK